MSDLDPTLGAALCGEPSSAVSEDEIVVFAEHAMTLLANLEGYEGGDAEEDGRLIATALAAARRMGIEETRS